MDYGGKETTMKMKKQLALPPGDDGMLIPGLPEHLALLCLARLPARLQAKASCVSLSWLHAFQAQALHSLRLSLGSLETWILIRLHSFPPEETMRNMFSFTQSWWLIDPLCARFSRVESLSGRWGDSLRPLTAGKRGEVFFYRYPTEERKLEIVCFDVFHRCRLQPSAPDMIPSRRTGFSSVFLNGHLYVVGGVTCGCIPQFEPLEAVERLDCNGMSSWERGPHTHICEQVALKAVERLDCNSMSSWERVPDMHIGRTCAVAVALHDCLYVIGGWGPPSEEILYSGEIWDPKSREWHLVPELWPHHIFQTPCGDYTVAVVMGHLLAIEQIKNEVMVYEQETRLWTSVGRVPIETFCNLDSKVSCKCTLLGVGNELWVVVEKSGPNKESHAVFILACIPFSGASIIWRQLPYCFDGVWGLSGRAAITI